MSDYKPYKRIQDNEMFPGPVAPDNVSVPTKVGNLTAAAYNAYNARAYAGTWFYGPHESVKDGYTRVPTWNPVNEYWKDFATIQAGPAIFQHFTSGRYPEHSGGFAHWPSGEANFAGIKNTTGEDNPAQYEDEYFNTYSSSPENKRLVNLTEDEESWLDNKPHPLMPAQRQTTETQGTDYSLFAADGIGTKKEDDADEQQSPFWYDRESKGGPFLSNSSGMMDSGQDVQIMNPYIHYIAIEAEEKVDGSDGKKEDLGYRINYVEKFEERTDYVDIYSKAFRNNDPLRAGTVGSANPSDPNDDDDGDDSGDSSTDPNVDPPSTTSSSTQGTTGGGY
jgi:hypothetical protein